MGKIFCLMGKSSSGKDTIYHELLQKENLQLKKIVMYTTRPMRSGEVEGEQYHFVTEATCEALQKQGKVVELRAYDTVHGVWKYFTVDDAQIDLDRQDYLVIGTIEAYEQYRDYFGGEQVVPLLIELADGERLKRAMAREEKEAAPRYEEMCRRFLADAKDFSEEKREAAGITKSFYNDDLNRCLAEIETYLWTLK